MGRTLVAGVALFMASAVYGAAPPFAGLVTRTYTSTDAAQVSDGAALVAVLTVEDMPGRVVDVDVTLDLPHTQASDLDISLVSPNGTTITLTTDNGGANDNVFASVTFDDQAPGTPAPAVRNVTFTDLVAVGTLQPEEALGALAGEPANGPWALVIVDDAGGNSGTLRSWSLTLSVLPGFQAHAPATFAGTGGPLPDGNAGGRTSTVGVSSLGPRAFDVNVTVDIRHPNAADIDLFLTSPSGRQIALVTDVGGGNDDLYVGTTFDDQAGTPASDTPLPTSGTAFTSVAGEGALAAFLGEDPNGTWTLTVVDDTGGNRGTLNGWTLAVSATACGDGVLDAGEQCDDGNATDGDGCDSTCTPSGPRDTGVEADCGNCLDDDQNGLVDAADPDCQARAFELGRSSIVLPATRTRLRVAGRLPVVPGPGPASLVVADGNGVVLCGSLRELQPGVRDMLFAHGDLAGSAVSIAVKPDGTLTLRGMRLVLPALDDPTVTIGLVLGTERFVATGTFRTRGRRWTLP